MVSSSAVGHSTCRFLNYRDLLCWFLVLDHSCRTCALLSVGRPIASPDLAVRTPASPFKETTSPSIATRHSIFAASTSDDNSQIESTGTENISDDPTTSSSSSSSSLPMPVSLIGATTSILVSGTFYVVLCWQRNAVMVAFFMGSIANGILSKVLKKLIAQSRPEGLAQEIASSNVAPSDGGMPSSHAMSLGFIGSFTAMHLPWTRVPLFFYIAISLYYRVQARLHTTAQIAAGLVGGTVHAVLFEQFYKEPLMAWLSTHVLNADGLLPVPLLIVPALVGALVVGSIERRLSYWLEQRKDKLISKEAKD